VVLLYQTAERQTLVWRGGVPESALAVIQPGNEGVYHRSALPLRRDYTAEQLRRLAR
jgi:hypothetical protein